MIFHRETNLKIRQAIPECARMGDDHVALSEFNGMLTNFKIFVPVSSRNKNIIVRFRQVFFHILNISSGG